METESELDQGLGRMKAYVMGDWLCEVNKETVLKRWQAVQAHWVFCRGNKGSR